MRARACVRPLSSIQPLTALSSVSRQPRGLCLAAPGANCGPLRPLCDRHPSPVRASRPPALWCDARPGRCGCSLAASQQEAARLPYRGRLSVLVRSKCFDYNVYCTVTRRRRAAAGRYRVPGTSAVLATPSAPGAAYAPGSSASSASASFSAPAFTSSTVCASFHSNCDLKPPLSSKGRSPAAGNQHTTH